MITKLALVVLVGATSPLVTAQDITAPSSHSYNQNSSGTITRSAYGLCWRSGAWTENDAIAGCDGALASPIPNPTAPDLVSIQAAPITLKHACNFTLVLGSDQTFAFNRVELNNAAKRQIDREVLPRLAECKTISITGHTDNLGTAHSNQILSENRAKSVADYLKSKISSTSTIIIGAGSSQPIKYCNEKLTQKKMINCLAPNRRVSLEITNSEK